MEDTGIHHIISLCKSLDEGAFLIYDGFSAYFKDKNTCSFWEDMAACKFNHIQCWKTLEDLAKKDIIPQIYDNPAEIIGNLNNIKERIDELLKSSLNIDEDQAFIIACRLEFYLIHPALEALMEFIKNMPFEGLEMLDYESHVENFFKGIRRYKHKSQALNLLSEIIQVLWYKNKFLARQSTIDSLTGVLNRRGFLYTVMPLMLSSISKREKVGVMMCDIDNFKKTNDNFGHHYGDTVLTETANTIRKSLRTFDVLGRYGGDEFIVYISHCDNQLIHDMAENIRRTVEYEGINTHNATISIGTECRLCNSDPKKDLEIIIKAADKRLYMAKRRGKNKVIPQ